MWDSMARMKKRLALGGRTANPRRPCSSGGGNTRHGGHTRKSLGSGLALPHAPSAVRAPALPWAEKYQDRARQECKSILRNRKWKCFDASPDPNASLEGVAAALLRGNEARHEPASLLSGVPKVGEIIDPDLTIRKFCRQHQVATHGLHEIAQG